MFIEPLFGGARANERVRYLQWLLGRNPFWTDEQSLPIYVFREASMPTGQLGIIPAEIVYSGRSLIAGWCIDFFIGPGSQRRGLGAQLLKAALQDFPVLMTLGQTDLAYRFFLKHGWRDRGQLTHSRALLNPSRTVPKLLLKKLGRQPRLRSLRAPQATYTAGDSLTLKVCEDPQELSLPQPNDSRSFGVSRSREYLAWRYWDCPFADYQVLSLHFGNPPQRAGDEAVAVVRIAVEDGWWKMQLVEVMYAGDMDDDRLRRGVKA